jgi:hypothetical protein
MIFCRSFAHALQRARRSGLALSRVSGVSLGS